jgi:hypothetical protein
MIVTDFKTTLTTMAQSKPRPVKIKQPMTSLKVKLKSPLVNQGSQ